MNQAVSPPPEFLEAAIPEISSEARSRCPVCSGDESQPFAEGYDYELRTCRNRWTFRQCTQCAHVMLDPRPRIDMLPVIYPPDYYSYNLSSQVSPIALKGKDFLDRLKFGSILRHLPRKPSSFLDIGCGDGRYLRLMERWQAIDRKHLFGLELSETLVAGLRAEGFQAIWDRVETCKEIAPRSIDVATMFHVIEHVDNPHEVIAKVADWLAPGGIFAIETPNLEALDARLFARTYWGGYHIPRHWHLFTETSLTKLLERSNLHVVAKSFQTGHSFWMYSFHHLIRYNRIFSSRRIARWFDPLRGLPLLVAFTAFDKVRAMLGFRTSSILMLARK